MIGIYFIQNIITKQYYIGQSKDVEARLHNHFLALRSDKHYNKKLQNSFNKYTEENFIYGIIEECSENELNDKEIYYIQKYKGNEPGNKKIFQQQELEIVELLKKNQLTRKQIGELYNVCASTIDNIALKHGLVKHRNKKQNKN